MEGFQEAKMFAHRLELSFWIWHGEVYEDNGHLRRATALELQLWKSLGGP